MSQFLFFTALIVAASGFEGEPLAEAAGRVHDGIYENEIVGPNLIKFRICSCKSVMRRNR